MSILSQRTIPAPVGRLRLVASDDALTGIYYPEHRPAPRVEATEVTSHPVLDLAARQLAEYFAGARRSFSVPLAPRGTAFQRAVWAALAEIAYGERCSYAALARALGAPRAVRAVGAANARNPLSIVLPCHRVIGSAGDLTGYAGGLTAKGWLLGHERDVLARLCDPAPPERACPTRP